MSNYPDTFDTTGPASLDDSYDYLNWTAVSVHRALAERPETSWELLPGLLGETWGDPDWYQRNEWLADFYNTVYQYASSVEPAQIFAVDELGEPAADMARVIDSVVQGWATAAHLHAEGEDPAYDEHDQWSEQEQWTGHDQWTGHAQWTDQAHDTGHDPSTGHDPAEYGPSIEYGPAQTYDPDAVTVDEPDEAEREPLADLDPDAARAVLAKVLDDEEDDLSAQEQQILATVLTVEEFGYLAREFELV
ncbi:hypothetical protein [Micromonospora sagamiensis]|uniref:Uncharacterized protein n=1 Tax=Micromonospora sagamiensis TaxID=47875 RepID=A0A562WLL4_9ACTN|nr:hypothetical protein [Micromonospora sagamiensis]TWJ31095.1 hypothetical protein JD81_04647 [Micromonospora sagamiensis]BCL15862.1 hypothetical protein GCM10017556_36010 [Micromonospora sagamiensis]